MNAESDEADGPRRINTREAARLLGVKPATVYAYVSRGQLGSRRDPVGRGSSFDAAEVEALARRSRREAAGPAGGNARELSVRTSLTLIEPDRYYFRGVDAVELASRYRYEEVAEWLWTGSLKHGARFVAPPEPLAAARRAVAALPEHGGPLDRLRVAVAAAAVADPLRFDLSEEAVLGSARCLIPTLVGALPEQGPARWAGDTRLARLLWSRLTALDPDPDALAVLDLALGLLVDHDLAASTLAVRVAASARAHPYAAVSAGLGALEGPLHGAAGRSRTGCWSRSWNGAGRPRWCRSTCARDVGCRDWGTGCTAARTLGPRPCSPGWRPWTRPGRRWARPATWPR